MVSVYIVSLKVWTLSQMNFAYMLNETTIIIYACIGHCSHWENTQHILRVRDNNMTLFRCEKFLDFDM